MRAVRLLLRADGQLGADERLQPGLAGRHVQPRRAVDAVPVEHGERRIAERAARSTSVSGVDAASRNEKAEAACSSTYTSEFRFIFAMRSTARCGGLTVRDPTESHDSTTLSYNRHAHPSRLPRRHRRCRRRHRAARLVRFGRAARPDPSVHCRVRAGCSAPTIASASASSAPAARAPASCAAINASPTSRSPRSATSTRPTWPRPPRPRRSAAQARRLPAHPRRQGHRRRRHRHARSLARADDRAGLPGRQGRLRREADVGGHRRRPRDGAGGAQVQAHRAGRHAAALGSRTSRRPPRSCKSGAHRRRHAGPLLERRQPRPNGIGNPPDGAPPADLDWDLWLGPAPKVPFNPNRFGVVPDAFSHFRWFWDYAGGMMTDWGVHLIDIVQMGDERRRAARRCRPSAASSTSTTTATRPTRSSRPIATRTS